LALVEEGEGAADAWAVEFDEINSNEPRYTFHFVFGHVVLVVLVRT
jgi:hypothetical protein